MGSLQRLVNRRCGVAARTFFCAIAPIGLLSACSTGNYLPRLGSFAPEGDEIVYLLPPVNVEEGEAKHESSIKVRRITQEKPDWCWAACAQMVHEYYGRTFTQQQLANLVHGEDIRAATYREIIIALHPKQSPPELEALRQTLGTIETMKPEVNPVRYVKDLNAHFAATSDDIIDSIKGNNPVVVVLDESPDDLLRDDYVIEHGYVVQSVGYVEDRSLLGDLVGYGKELFSWIPGPTPDDRERLLKAANSIDFKYALAWIELIDPDPLAVEDDDPDEPSGMHRPRAIVRIPAAEFAERVNLILTPACAAEFSASHSPIALHEGGAR